MSSIVWLFNVEVNICEVTRLPIQNVLMEIAADVKADLLSGCQPGVQDLEDCSAANKIVLSSTIYYFQ